MSFTLTTLTSSIQEWTQNDEATFVAEIPFFIKNAEERIKQMKNQALKDIKNTSVKIAIESVEKLLKNSIDKSKLDKIYLSSIEETKLALKKKSS